MTLSPNPHRAALTEQAAAILRQYEEFRSDYQVSFSVAENGLLHGTLSRVDGVPFNESRDPTDGKLARLRDQTAVIRPFFLPMMARKWDESDANEFTTADFDYAAILGYAPDPQGGLCIKNLYYLPTGALLDGKSPDADGVWRLPLATYHVHRMSLEPRRKFAKFLFLAERMREGLEYQYDSCGFFYSTRAI